MPPELDSPLVVGVSVVGTPLVVIVVIAVVATAVVDDDPSLVVATPPLSPHPASASASAKNPAT